MTRFQLGLWWPVIKCVHLLVLSYKITWFDISLLYGVVLAFVTDSRSKVTDYFVLCMVRSKTM